MPRSLLHLLEPRQNKKSDYFTKHHPPSHHTEMSNQYLHKANHSINFIPTQGCINHVLELDSTVMSHEPWGPKYNRQETGSSTFDGIMLVRKETCPKSNCQEPVGSTSNHLTLVLKKSRHAYTHNKITAPFINNTHKTYIPQKCNILYQKYAAITKNMWTSEHNSYLLVNINTTPINVIMWFNYQY